MSAHGGDYQHLGYLERHWLMRTLASAHTSEDVHVWMTATHERFGGLTVNEMVAAGRKDEVFDAAEADIDRLLEADAAFFGSREADDAR